MLARYIMNYNIQKANELMNRHYWVAEFTNSSIILRWPNGATKIIIDFNDIFRNINKS